jgi:type III secretion system FlhB-like substrate exporter
MSFIYDFFYPGSREQRGSAPSSNANGPGKLKAHNLANTAKEHPIKDDPVLRTKLRRLTSTSLL